MLVILHSATTDKEGEKLPDLWWQDEVVGDKELVNFIDKVMEGLIAVLIPILCQVMVVNHVDNYS